MQQSFCYFLEIVTRKPDNMEALLSENQEFCVAMRQRKIPKKLSLALSVGIKRVDFGVRQTSLGMNLFSCVT